MPGIIIHDDKSPMRGAVLFLNKAMNAFLETNQERAHEPKFKHLTSMLQNDLYLADLRFPTENERYCQFDLVGFTEHGEPRCFTFRANKNLDIHQFKTTAFINLCDASQEMAADIQQYLGFVNPNSEHYSR